MAAGYIKITVEVDTDDLDIAIGKAKELNRELKKAKALADELAHNESDTAEVIKCVIEQLRRDIKVGY